MYVCGFIKNHFFISFSENVDGLKQSFSPPSKKIKKGMKKCYMKNHNGNKKHKKTYTYFLFER